MKKSRHAALLGLLLVAPAWSATLSGSFVYPSAYTDGSPLSLSDIKLIRVEVGTCASINPTKFGVAEKGVSVLRPKTTYSVVSPRVSGNFCLRARTRLYSGDVSAWSAPARKSIIVTVN